MKETMERLLEAEQIAAADLHLARHLLALDEKAPAELAPLVALASHRPENLVVFYDEKTAAIQEAACRLSSAVSGRYGSVGRLRVEKFVPVPSDHTNRNIGARIETLRRKLPGPWDFNLSPGTKEQSLMLVLHSRPGDRFWVMDQRGRRLRELSPGKTPGERPQAYPGLLAVARYCGGTLRKTHRVLDRKTLTESGGLDAAARVLARLAGEKNARNLTVYPTMSAAERRRLPVWFEEGCLYLRGGESRDLRAAFPGFSFVEPRKGTEDPNLWWEPVVGSALLRAGADEVICGLEWNWGWNSSGWNRKAGFRDEVDVLARFGTRIVVVSCKSYLPRGEKKTIDFWEVDNLAGVLFGRFARPFLAVPVVVPPGDERPLEGCATRLLGVNRLTEPGRLGSWLLEE